MSRRAALEPWAVFPLGLFAALIAVHVALVWRLHAIGADAVEDRPYLASQRFDEDRAARDRFVERGLAMEWHPEEGRLRLAVRGLPAGGVAGPATVACYRPDERALDREVTWDDPSRPLTFDLPAAGLWIVTVGFTLDGETVAARATVLL